MITVTVKREVKIQCSADDWGLYDHDDREACAIDLNNSLEFYSRSHTRADCHRLMERQMASWFQVGAADSEGYHTLDTLLDKIYGV